MSRNQHQKTSFDRARDELFSHIHRCEVLGAAPEQQAEWMEDTLMFMAERYPSLGARELQQLKELGLRFCQPIIPHGQQHATDTDEEANAA